MIVLYLQIAIAFFAGITYIGFAIHFMVSFRMLNSLNRGHKIENICILTGGIICMILGSFLTYVAMYWEKL